MLFDIYAGHGMRNFKNDEIWDCLDPFASW